MWKIIEQLKNQISTANGTTKIQTIFRDDHKTQHRYIMFYGINTGTIFV